MKAFSSVASMTSRLSQRIGPMAWVWITILAALLASSGIIWIEEHQNRLITHFTAEQTLLRQARTDLAKGYLHVSLGGPAGSPFNRAQGFALLDQAGSSLERALQLQREFAAGSILPRADEASRARLADFVQAAVQFRDLLMSRKGVPETDPARETELRIVFFTLERQADTVDSQIQQDLSGMINHYDQIQVKVSWISGILFALICASAIAGDRARKRAERGRRDAEIRFRLLFEQSPDGIVVIDPETTRFLEFNETAHRQLGYSRDEFAGLSISDLEDPEKPGQILTCLAKLRGEQRGDFEVQHRTRRGVLRNIHVTAQLTEMLGRPVYHCVWRDITERKRAEKALGESEEQFKAMFETASIGMAQADPKTGQWLRVNRKMCEITGYSPAEMLTKRIHEITHPDDRLRDREAFEGVTSGKSGSYRLEKRYIRKDGAVVWVNVNMTVIRDPSGQPTRTMATIEDITDRKRAEEETAKLQDQLLQSQKMESIGRLAGGVAHDFNNMLGVILGHAEMALDKVGPSELLYTNFLEIRKAAERSSDLTRQLLAFARKQTIAPKVLDLNETVTGMLKMLQRLIGEDIHLVWCPGADLWPVKVDPSQIDQILANLSVNARDAIEGVGKFTIETKNIVFDEAHGATHAGSIPGEYVLLAVSDNGCGMDKKTVDKLFEPFFTTKEIGKGTGLGLSTVYGIVKQNNGFINVYSEPGQGTTFKIYVPRHTGMAERVQRDGSVEPVSRGTETILLVEDERAILDITTRMLQQQGYTVLAACTPGEAIRLAEAHSGEIHLLMTDVVMPEMNGRDLARNILSFYPNLKRLFMSGYTANVIAHHGVLDDGVNFIQKPFTRRDLTVKIREVLEEHGG